MDDNDKSILERGVNLMGDVARQNIRAVNGDKTDEELGLDEPFYQESLFSFYKGEANRFKTFMSNLKNKFIK